MNEDKKAQLAASASEISQAIVALKGALVRANEFLALHGKVNETLGLANKSYEIADTLYREQFNAPTMQK